MKRMKRMKRKNLWKSVYICGQKICGISEICVRYQRLADSADCADGEKICGHLCVSVGKIPLRGLGGFSANR